MLVHFAAPRHLALAQEPGSHDPIARTPTDQTFHALDREGRWAAALEHARRHLRQATSCEDSIRWHIDLASATTRVGLRQEALSIIASALKSTCLGPRDGHRYVLAVAAAETHLALEQSDAAMRHAMSALEVSESLNLGTGARLDAASLIAGIAGCDGGLAQWMEVSDGIRQEIEGARDSVALLYLREMDYLTLHSLRRCAPARTVSTDSLIEMIDGIVELGSAIGHHPEQLLTYSYFKYGILAEAGNGVAAVSVLAAATERALHPGSRISADGKIALLSALSEGQLIVGDIAGALETARLALNTARRSENVLARIRALSSYGDALLMAGQIHEASVQLEDAERSVLSLGLETLLASQAQSESSLLRNSRSPMETWRLINEALAQIAGRSGAYRAAEVRFRRVYALGEAVGDSAAMHRALLALSSTRLLQGDSLGAMQFERRAGELELDEEVGGPLGSQIEVSRIMNDLMSDDTVQSRTAWEAADRLLGDGLGQRAPDLAAGLHYRRALVLLPRYVATSDTRLLQSLIDESHLAIGLLEDGPATQVLQMAYALLGTAFEYKAIAQGGDVPSSEHLVEAVRYHRLAIRAAAELHHAQLRASSLGQLALVEWYRGDTVSADSAFQRAIRAAEEARFLVGRDEAVRSRHMTATSLSRVYANAVRFYYDSGRYGDALVIAELAKSRGLSDLMVQREVGKGGKADPIGALGTESRSSIVSETAAIPKGLRQNLEAAAEEWVRVDSAVAEAFQESLRSTLSETAIHELAVDPELAVLSFFVDRFSGVVYAWLIDEGAVSGSAALLTDDVQRQLDKLARHTHESTPGRFGRGPAPRTATSTVTGKLLAALVGEFLDTLIVQSRAKRLVVIPDGRLNLIPFSALSAGDTLLGERFSLVVLPALHLAAVDRATDAAAPISEYFLGIVDPGGSLPRAGPEVHRAAEFFERTEILADPAATEEAVHDRWRAAKVMHFATHAVAVDTAPNAGYISVAAGPSSDGRLTVNEVLDTSGLNAELVVLSACETGGGMVLEGEGIMGFGRAFLAAGAESVLVTLWPIGDGVAEFFMDRFYRHWRTDDMPIAMAFQRAKASTRARYPELRDWAAFRLISRDW